MFPLTRIQLLKFAAAGALIALSAANTPARADEMVQHLGPVAAYEPILTTVGKERVIAFYVPHGRHCAVHAVVWYGMDADTASRVRVSLNRGQIAHIDTADNKSLNLRCGHGTLTIVDVGEHIVFRLNESVGE